MANEIRVERIQSLIMKELNLFLKKDFSDTKYLKDFIIHEVKLTKDLSRAKIYYTILGDCENILEAESEIAKHIKEIRSILAEKIDIRFAPEIEFKFDESLEKANRIEEILKGIKK